MSKKIKKVKKITYAHVKKAVKEWDEAFVLVHCYYNDSEHMRIRRFQPRGFCWYNHNVTFTNRLNQLIPSCFRRGSLDETLDGAADYDKRVLGGAEIIGLYKTLDDVNEACHRLAIRTPWRDYAISA